MKYKNLITPNLKYSVAVLALFAFPDLDAQSKPKRDTVKEKTIQEVVMIGYGTAKKSDLTGSVAVIKGADLKNVPVASVAEALTGRVAGLSVTSTEGSPDATINLKVRGGTSISQDSSPLIIVDGFPVNSLNDISSSDIENISVLKDASSTAIYGSRGANGVVLITTKSGREGKLSVSLNSFMGYKFLAKKIKVLSPYDYAKWQYEYAMLDSSSPTPSNANATTYEKYFGQFNEMNKFKDYEALDWQDKLMGNTGTFQNTDLGVRGGSDKISYNLGLTHYKEDGILMGSGFKRDNITLGLKNKASKNLEIGLKFRYSKTTIDGSGTNEQKEASSADSRLRNMVGYSPINIPGLVSEDIGSSTEDDYLINPYVANRDNARSQDKRNYSMQGSINWKIIKNLEFHSEIGTDFYRNKDNRFYGVSTYYARTMPLGTNQNKPALIMIDEENNRFRIANTLNYDFKSYLGEDHSVKLLLGQEYINYTSNVLTNTMQGYFKTFTFEDAVNFSSSAQYANADNFNYQDDRLFSFFGRVNYDYKDKYLLTATMRADGSSKFLDNNKWGYFPSAALGWKLSSESFLENVDWIKFLKLRASYGKAGNNNIPVGQLVQTYQNTLSAWINNVANYWAPYKIMANPDLKWETTTTQNVGLDFELFKGKLSGTIDLYKNKTSDLLLLFPTIGTGYDAQYRNMGDNQNKGLEITLNYDAIKKQDYKLSFAINSAWNKNKILSLGIMNDFTTSSTWTSSPAIGNDYLISVGNPLGLIYGYVSDGRYEVSDFDYNNDKYTLKAGIANSNPTVGYLAPGSMKLKDLNGDGVVNDKDRTVIGNTNPKSTGGFTINGVVKNFDISAAFNWSIGNDVYNADKIEFTSATTSPDGQYRNLSAVMADGSRWTNIDPNSGALVTDPTALAALNANTTMWSPYMSRYVVSSWAIEDGSFLRLNTLTLGYSLPDSLVKKLKLSKIRLFATGYNLFVLTNYSGSDPEVSTRRKTPLTPGVDSSPYPRSRQIVFGFNLNF
ncbi:SusC/RagA family TonB-linked outer membrane protein [Cloacibacterium sp.]|uniref:SusC/RagA family TonB-linked outer membrane protein n=1 Tax=Cloacibacterium sp. TaxID=1913682 RepID=UPI0039E5AF24